MTGFVARLRSASPILDGISDELRGLYDRLCDKVNYVPGSFQGIRIERGQLLTAMRTIQGTLYANVAKPPCANTIWRRLEQLHDLGLIELRTAPRKKGTLVTVLHYGTGQKEDAPKFGASSGALVSASSGALGGASSGALGGASSGALVGADKRKEELQKATTATTEVEMPEMWQMLWRDLFSNGKVEEAKPALQAAFDRGWPIEYVGELLGHYKFKPGFKLSDHSAGKLVRVLKGVIDPPFDETFAREIQARREAEAKLLAEKIRRDAFEEGTAKGVTQRFMMAVTSRRLRLEGLERFATDDEREKEVELREYELQQQDNAATLQAS